MVLNLSNLIDISYLHNLVSKKIFTHIEMEAKERRANMANSDNNGYYSVFTLTQKELKIFFLASKKIFHTHE